MKLLECVEIEPRKAARSSVIWLHGLGADGHDFPPIVPELGLTDELAIRWIFPHSQRIPVTINGGMVMPAWYDIVGLDARSPQDEQGIRDSAQQIEDLIDRERERGVDDAHIVLAGFSQGGAIAAHTALRHEKALAGLVMLSTYLVLPETLEAERSSANSALPIFQAHGTHDPMVSHARGVESRDRLVALGYAPEWHAYPMAHQVCIEEIRELGRWFSERL